MLFQNFSSKSQFRLKHIANFYRTPTLTQLLKKSGKELDEEPMIPLARRAIPKPSKPSFAATAMARIPSVIRLNIKLTPKFHDVIMQLARPRTEVAEGCFVDFKIMPRILIPATTVMSAEILGELLANLKHFEKHIAELQRDLTQLSELGELPLRFIGDQNTIRVYFPNCDRARLEALLLEKNVLGGIIFEDVANECALLDTDSVSTVSDFDVLSSCNLLSLVSSGSGDYDDVLSSSASEAPEHIVRLQTPERVLETLGTDQVRIAEDECYYWV